MSAQDDDLENDAESADASGDLDVAANDAMPAVGTSSMKMPSAQTSMNPTLQQYLQGKQQALASAQQQASRNEMLTGLARAGASLSAGLAHSNAPVDQAPFNAMAATDQAPVTDFMAQQKSQAADISNKGAMDASDPTSTQSIATQNMIKKLYPGKYDDATLSQLSASEIGSSIMKPLELDQKITEHKDEMASKAADRKDAAAGRADTKATADQVKAQDFAINKLEAARSDQGVKQAQVDLYSTKKINSLIALYPDPNSMSPEMVKLLVAEIAKVATGGVPGESATQGITPNTLMGRMGSAWETLSNHPSGANAAAFISQYKSYSGAIADDARSTIKGKVDSIVNVKRKDMGDERYQNLKDNYYTRFGLSSDDSLGAAPGPNDHASRAAAILAKRQASNPAPVVPLPNYASPQPGAPAMPSTGSPSQDSFNPNSTPGFAYGGQVQPPGFQHVRQQLAPHLPTFKPPKMAKAPVMQVPVTDTPLAAPAHFYSGGEVKKDNGLMPDPEKARQAAAGADSGGPSLAQGWQNLKNEFLGGQDQSAAHNYAQGGTVAGQPKVPYNSPQNDTVDAKLTPKEEVLPLSVTQSKAPALAAYLHMKSRGYK
jgi:hypothetical protein